MDVAQLLRELQAQNAGLQQRVDSLSQQLAAVVEEYGNLEKDSGARERVLTGGLVDSSRLYFSCLRVLWEGKGRGSGATAVQPQQVLTVALAHMEKLQRSLAVAGLPEVADAAASAAGEDAQALVQAAATQQLEALASGERDVLHTAVRELSAEREALAAEAAAARAAAAESAGHVEALSAVIQQLQAQLAAQQAESAERLAAVGREVLVDGVAWTAVQVRALQRERDEARQSALAAQAAAAVHEQAADKAREALAQAEAAAQEAAAEAGAARALAASAAAAATLRLPSPAEADEAAMAAVAEEAQRRVKAAEAAMSTSAAAHEREVAALRAKIGTLESANATLSRSLTSVRGEVELLTEKHAAQCGVIDVLRAELAEADLRFARLHAHKAEVARRAAVAIREVEGQVKVLTAAVESVKARDAAAAATVGLGGSRVVAAS